MKLVLERVLEEELKRAQELRVARSAHRHGFDFVLVRGDMYALWLVNLPILFLRTHAASGQRA